METNQATLSNETTGWSFYERAKKVIPGGTQLLSKRPEMFLPQGWPSYHTRAKGCEVWDLEGRKFVDMTISGVGTCLLGFADDDVNAAAKNAIDQGTISTLNSPLEVELAELLCELHPWSGMVRFTRSGGEAMMVAVRIARALTGRSGIACCGYHGWGDWYLAANLNQNRALDGHLLPGLQPNGVPRELVGTAQTFRYNHIEDLERIVSEQGKSLAAIVLESMRFTDPIDGFLEKVRQIADRTGAVLILDEITAGWRHVLGGAHLKLGMTPDIAVYAKSMSNGIPMAAVVGTESVMQAAQESFISSTYWTEAMGPAAALACIRKMRRVNLPAHTAAAGVAAQQGWQELAAKHKLNITVMGWPALCTFSLNYGDLALPMKTLLTQEMLDRGYLANTTFYPTLSHNRQVMEDYLAALNEVFEILACAVSEDSVSSRLRGPVAHSGFARLT
jgi:glutamate-1-semialdehyde aminotransferase